MDVVDAESHLQTYWGPTPMPLSVAKSLQGRQRGRVKGFIDRRQFVGSAAATALAGPGLRPDRAAAHDAYSSYDGIGQAQLVRSKQATALELVDSAIARIEAANPKLNAIVWEMFEHARARAKGELPASPLSGVPYLIKDLNNVAGERTTWGSRFSADTAALINDPAPQKAIDAGLVIVGKTNTPEFGLLPTTESIRLGPCHNPWNLDCSPGGSSGGAAAAVAAGLVPAAHASDGGGSIRIPSSCCGVFGLKPSRLRMNLGLENTVMGGILTENCVSRTVRDNAMLFSLTEDTGDFARFKPIGFVAEPAKRRLNIAFTTTSCNGVEPHPDVKAAVEATAKLCESLGHIVVPAQCPVDGQAFNEAFRVVWLSLPAKLVQLAKSKNLNPENFFEPYTLALADCAMTLPPDAMGKALTAFTEIEAQVGAFLANCDAWLTPVLALPPVRLGELAPTVDPKTLSERVTHYVVYTQIHNIAGTPAMSAPLGMSQDGLPIGSQFAAAKGREDLLYALAYELEAAQPWTRRTPQVWMG
jgi:amidase